MRKTFTLCCLLLLATFSVGQMNNSSAAQQDLPMGEPIFAAPMIFFPLQPGGLLVQSGYATTVGWPYPPLLVTPVVSLSGVPATSNLQVGISNSTIESLDVPVSAVPVAMEVVQAGAVVPTEFAFPPPAAQARGFAGAGNDFGAAHFDVVSTRWSGETRSPGEVARALRERPMPPPVRTLTNADVRQLKNEPLRPQNPQR